MHETCCPQYTIRLDVSRFKPNKGQRQLLNRLKRYLGSDDIVTSGESGRRKPRAQGAPFAAADERGSGRNPRKSSGSQERSGSKSKPPYEGSSSSSSGRREDSQSLGELSARVTASAIAAVEGGAICGAELMPSWRSEVEGWSRVRPIRNKKHRSVCNESGGFCTTVALSIASAARKRGWSGTGGDGGAVAIAESVAARMREGVGVGLSSSGALASDVTVAPNGFINFIVADLGSSSEPVYPQPPPSQSVKVAATIGESPPSATPPTLSGRPELSRMLHVGETLNGDGVRNKGNHRAVVKGPPRERGGAAQARRTLHSGAEVEIPSTRIAAGEGGAAASIEWSEIQESMTDAMDTTASSFPSRASPARVVVPRPSTGLSSLPPLDPELKSHRMTVTTVPAQLTDEVFSLYAKYQVSVHGDEPCEVTRVSFRRFLVDSPLLRESLGGVIEEGQDTTRRESGSRSGPLGHDGVVQGGVGAEEGRAREARYGDSLTVPYGSYHQLYRIDNRLIAVGVVDILPKCLSSVYCFYDPDYRALSLGKLTALMETEFVREAGSLRPALRDYYMGFYIHTCPKMSYKGSYAPSSLLCPEKLCWVPLELCRPVLDRRKYARLSELLDPPPQSLSSPADVGDEEPRGTVRGDRISEDSVLKNSRFASSSSSRRGTKDDSRQRQRGVASDEGQGKGMLFCQPPLSKHRATGQGRRTGKPGITGASPPDGDDFVNEAEVDLDEASGINTVPLLLGRPPFPVSMAVLTPHAKAMIRDVLKTYMATMGPDLARRIILKLYG